MPHSSAFSVPCRQYSEPLSPQRALRDKASRALLVSPGPCGPNSCLACQYLLPPFGLAGLTPLPWFLVPPSLDQPGQMWDQVHTVGSCLLCLPSLSPVPVWCLPGPASTGRGACPCFFSDWEINTPEGVWEVWSILLVLRVCRERQESSGGWGSLRSYVLNTRLSATNSPFVFATAFLWRCEYKTNPRPVGHVVDPGHRGIA